MSAPDAALRYAARGWPVFPCTAKKVPLVQDWPNTATTDPGRLRAWWRSWPHALIGTTTGMRTDIAVLDVDMKNGVNGIRTLAGLLGTEDLPITPTVRTASGGLHLHFRRPAAGFGNTVGAAGRGIGDGLDWRCDGGYVVLPAPGTGYLWGDWSYETCTPIDVPEVLLPRRIDLNAYSRYASGTGGRLAAINVNSLSGVARKLAAATEGERNALLYWSACRFGEAIAQGLIGEDDARRILTEAASRLGLPNREITRTVDSAFARAGQ